MTHPPTLPLDTALLVIGYGNPLRNDDGAGPRVADLIESLHLPNVRTLAPHQLAPEHAASISRARLVIFVDASVPPGSAEFPLGRRREAPPESPNPPSGNLALPDSPIHLRKLTPGATTQLLAHAADPQTLLALARDVYGRAPEAWWLTIPAQQLGFGTDYSPAAEAGVHAAVTEIQRIAADSITPQT